ncbi:MAG: carboxylesterase family protein [Flavobacteriales bacterium]|nr:carboxylesterase family protein [Flavobacteriales bacterium]
MKHFSALSFLALFSITAHAQECADGRYIDANHFGAVTITSAVTFGANTAVAGGNQILKMDVYEPTGDALALRPAVLVAFGGSFITGSRADVADICTDFAKRGYVAVGYDYRVGFFLPNQTTTTRAVMRGAHDTRACVRYLHKSVAELGNPYGIDTTRIIIGGVSAGAISAVHATYLNEDSEIPAWIAGEMPGLGGLEGNSGNPGYSSVPLACYSFSGCIGDTSWINTGDQPLVSLHEVGDGVVPYYTQEVSVAGIPTGLIASGSHDIHERANHVGLVNCFKSYPGTGHVGYLTSDYVVAMNYTALFLGQVVCGQEVTCDLNTAVAEVTTRELLPAPNPTTGVFRMELPEAAVITVLDVSGRVVLVQRAVPGVAVVDLSANPVGVYAVQVMGEVVRNYRVVRGE